MTRDASAPPGDRAGLASFVLIALVWGIHWPVVRIGLDYVPPYTYGAARVLIALVVMVALLGLTGGLRLPPRGDLGVVAAVGLGQMATAIVLMNLALDLIPPGHASVLSYTSPLWVALLGTATGRSLGRREWLGVALGVVGITLIVNPLTLGATAGGLLGSVMMLASAIVWAVTIMYLRQHHWQASPLQLTPWELLLALVPLSALAIAFDAGRPVEATWQAAATLLYSGLLATALAYLTMQTIARSVSPLLASLGLLAVPVVGLVASAIALREPLGPVDLAGIAVCLAGIALVTTARLPVPLEADSERPGMAIPSAEGAPR